MPKPILFIPGFPASELRDRRNGRTVFPPSLSTLLDPAKKAALIQILITIPGNLVAEDTLMLSLMRSHNLGAYGFGGGYEPGMASETGFQMGKRLTFQYALVPHAGAWRDAEVYRAGMEFNHPLLARKVAPHPGLLPGRWGMLEVSHSNVVLTALKPGPGKTTVLRVYEAAGQATAGVTLKLRTRLAAASEANLLEDSGRALKIQNDSIRFDLHPFEIKTIRLQLEPPKKGG